MTSPGSILEEVRRRRPLVHHLTNLVTMHLVANTTIAAGGLPVMAFQPEEAREVSQAADALVLNTGTPQRHTSYSMIAAGKAANQKGIPVVLDPVGAGLSSFRDRIIKTVLRHVKVTVIRGNAAEASRLAGLDGHLRGVTATGGEDTSAHTAHIAAASLATTVAVTGPVDYVSDGNRLVLCRNGHEMMSLISGSGCVVSALTALFCAVEKDSVVAAACALAYAGAAGEKAAGKSAGPGSFQVNWLDALWRMRPGELDEMARIEWGIE